MHIDQFPKEVQNFIYELCAKAMIRLANKEYSCQSQNRTKT
jgi:hypothetical protein